MLLIERTCYARINPNSEFSQIDKKSGRVGYCITLINREINNEDEEKQNKQTNEQKRKQKSTTETTTTTVQTDQTMRRNTPSKAIPAVEL